jgi:hypothetical protein
MVGQLFSTQKIEVFMANCKRNEVKFYYQRYEKGEENQGNLRKMGWYKTFREILQEEKIKYQNRNVYNKEYPCNPIPNEVFKTKEYYNWLKDKWEERITGEYIIDRLGIRIPYDKPNMMFNFECDDGMVKYRYEEQSKIVIKEIKE